MKRRFQQADVSTSSSTTLVLPATVQPLPQVNTLPPLKLRIKQQSIVQELTVFIYEASNAMEILKFLLHFHHQLRTVDLNSEECEQISRHLKDLVRKESDHLVRAKAIELISEVCYLPAANKNQCTEEIFECLHKESEYKSNLLQFNSYYPHAVLLKFWKQHKKNSLDRSCGSFKSTPLFHFFLCHGNYKP